MVALDPSVPPANEPHQVVIIGASLGGIPAAHGLLREVLPALSVARNQKFKVTLISPNDHFYWMIGAPRLIVKPGAFPLESLLLSIADAFGEYSKDQFGFINAHATSIDPTTKTVSISTNQTINYDSLLIASGVTFANSVWTASNGLQALQAELKQLHEQIPICSSILIAGGGAVGVETAGELAEAFGGSKDILLLSGSTQLLPRLQNKVIGKEAEARLGRLGTKVIHDVRVQSHHTSSDCRTSLKLSDGTEKIVDVYIDATGVQPNSKFVPDAWLNQKGFVKTDGSTLRVDVPDLKNVYCIGSVGSYSDGGVMDVRFAMKALLESIRLDLAGDTSETSPSSTDPLPSAWIAWLTSWIPFFGSTVTGTRKNLYKKFQGQTQFIPIGPKQGVGVGLGWKLPSFAIVLLKSRDFRIKDAPKFLNGRA